MVYIAMWIYERRAEHIVAFRGEDNEPLNPFGPADLTISDHGCALILVREEHNQPLNSFGPADLTNP